MSAALTSFSVSRHASSKDVCLCFSSRNTDKGKFTLFKQMQRVPTSVIFVNDYANRWYLEGTPEFADREEFVARLRATIAELSGEEGRLFCIGASMGGYAALYYGALLQADRIFAMGPESELGLPLGRSVTSLPDVPEGSGDISALTYKDPRQVLIVSGSADIVDVYCAVRFKAGNPLLDVRLLENRRHEVAGSLNEQFGLGELAAEYFYGLSTASLDSCSCTPLPDIEQALALKRCNEALAQDRVPLELAGTLRTVAELNPGWAMPQYFCARISEAQQDLQQSEIYLRRALQAQPTLSRALLRLASVLVAAGREPEAVELLQQARAARGSWTVSEQLCRVYVDMGQPLAAVALLRDTDTDSLKPAEKLRFDRYVEQLMPQLLGDGAALFRATDSTGLDSRWRDVDLALENSSLEAGEDAFLHCGAGCVAQDARIRLARGAELHVGEGCRLSGDISLEEGARLHIGRGLRMERQARIELGQGTLAELGDDCLLSGATLRLSGEWMVVDLQGRGVSASPPRLRLGHGVLVREALLEAGAELGDEVLVEAGSVLRQPLPDSRCVVAGNPAQVVRRDVRWVPREQGPVFELPEGWSPEEFKANAGDYDFVLRHGLAFLPNYRGCRPDNYWFFYYTARAVYETYFRRASREARSAGEAPVSLEYVLAVLSHCNRVGGYRNSNCLGYECAVLRSLGEWRRADTLASLILVRWPRMEAFFEKLLFCPLRR